MLNRRQMLGAVAASAAALTGAGNIRLKADEKNATSSRWKAFFTPNTTLEPIPEGNVRVEIFLYGLLVYVLHSDGAVDVVVPRTTTGKQTGLVKHSVHLWTSDSATGNGFAQPDLDTNELMPWEFSGHARLTQASRADRVRIAEGATAEGYWEDFKWIPPVGGAVGNISASAADFVAAGLAVGVLRLTGGELRGHQPTSVYGRETVWAFQTDDKQIIRRTSMTDCAVYRLDVKTNERSITLDFGVGPQAPRISVPVPPGSRRVPLALSSDALSAMTPADLKPPVTLAHNRNMFPLVNFGKQMPGIPVEYRKVGYRKALQELNACDPLCNGGRIDLRR